MASQSIFAVPEPQPHRDSISEFPHFAQFYHDDAGLTERMSRYLGRGLDSGDSLLVIATGRHREMLETALREQGRDLALCRSKGRYLAADAEQMLAGIMAGCRPDPARFDEAVGSLVEQAAARGESPQLRIFGEMVACLWQSGQPNAAIHLEELWNHLFSRWKHTRSLSLCCAYPLACFQDPGQTDAFLRICAEHAGVFPAGAYGQGENPSEAPSGSPGGANAALLSAVAKLEQAAFSYQKLAGRFLHEQEQERSRLGNALHDGIAQKLALLAIRLDQLRDVSGNDTASLPDALDEAFSAVREQVNEISDDVHQFSHTLHSAILEQLGLLAGLRCLIAEFSEQHGILVHLESSALPERLPPELALSLYRAAEESLRNVAQHSGAPSARVTLACLEGEIHLAIEDAGRGFDPARLGPSAGLGLIRLRERLRSVQGSVQIHSSPFGGARVEVRVPYKQVQPA